MPRPDDEEVESVAHPDDNVHHTLARSRLVRGLHHFDGVVVGTTADDDSLDQWSFADNAHRNVRTLVDPCF